MNRSFLLLFILAGVFFQPGQSAAQDKLQSKEALLIANGDYSHFGKLPNPISDARLLEETLEKIGFHVTRIENASREQMLDALRAFEERLTSSRGIAFFHYGGHGVQVAGHNYLIPADADIPDEKRVATRSLELDEVLSALDASGSIVNVIVLDACRDNPLPKTASRSTTRGLSVVESRPKNSMIVYAAKPGCKAQDGLFTPTLASALAQPGLSLSEIMIKVRREVLEKSGGDQLPGDYSELIEQVYLSGSGNVSLPSSATSDLLLTDKCNATATNSYKVPIISREQTPSNTSEVGKSSAGSQSPVEAVLGYYNDINCGNYEKAWESLPFSLKENKRIHPQGFESFKSYFKQIVPIRIGGTKIAESGQSEAIVEVQFSYVDNGRLSSMTLRYSLVKDNLENRWIITSVKKSPSFSEASPSNSQQGVWLFNDSSQRLLSIQELSSLSSDDLWRARNEIYARKGYIFQTERGKSFAASLGSNYRPISPSEDAILQSMNSLERSNISLIKQLESQRK
jgi:uncharacterized caspase-like protein